MDFISHGLYGGAIIIRKAPQYYWLAVASGMLPDLLAGAFAMSKVGVLNGIKKFAGEDAHLPEPVYKFYYVTHSFITTGILALLLYLIRKDLVILALPYAFHILCDIPFHRSRFCTRFLYPLSNFHIKGFSYKDHKWLYIPNYFIIIILYLFLLKQ